MIRLNAQELPVTVFPDNTSQVWHIPDELMWDVLNYVEWNYEHEGEIFRLLQLDMLLHSMGKTATLKVPYFPYARQDKPVSNDETFSLYALIKILKQMHWASIITCDVHNPKVFEERDLNLYNNKYVFEAYRYDTIIFPDKGASTRYDIKHANIVIGDKVRDPATGWITDYSFEGEVKGHALVVDDLCDGGMTFLKLSQCMPKRDGETHLYVTHGIFSKGLHCLMMQYDKVITTNSYFGHIVKSNDIPCTLFNAAAQYGGIYAEMLYYYTLDRLVIEGC